MPIEEALIRVYMDATDKWVKECRLKGHTVRGEWWELLTYLDQCYPGIGFRVERYLNSNVEIKVNLWLIRE